MLYSYYYESRPRSAFTYEEGVLSLSPVGYWPCDDASGNLVDVTGNGWTMTLTNASTYQQAGPSINGVAHLAVEFSGTSFFETTTLFPTTYTDGRTYAAWVMIPSTSSAAGRFLARRASNQNEMDISHAANGDATCNAYQSDGATLVAQAAGADIDGGAWHLLVGWWEASSQDVSLQIDGGTPTTAAGATNLKNDSTAGIGMGATASGSDVLRAGSRMCHAAVWNRVLTSIERANLFSGDF
jgi:hypothetical protein